MFTFFEPCVKESTQQCLSSDFFFFAAALQATLTVGCIVVCCCWERLNRLVPPVRNDLPNELELRFLS